MTLVNWCCLEKGVIELANVEDLILGETSVDEVLYVIHDDGIRRRGPMRMRN